jgi:hypothetical protein
MRHIHEFRGRSAAGSGKSGDPILHQELPHIKKRSDATGDFKNHRRVDVSLFRPKLIYDLKG